VGRKQISSAIKTDSAGEDIQILLKIMTGKILSRVYSRLSSIHFDILSWLFNDACIETYVASMTGCLTNVEQLVE
jgi:hypothetical protein